MNYRILLLDSTGSADAGWTGAWEWDEYGFEIAGRTADPVDAVSALSRGDFDAVLCLHRPSQETAVALLSRLQKRVPDIPAIIVSTADDSTCMRQCFLYGATDFLVMPLNADDVRCTLQRAARQLDRRVIYDPEGIDVAALKEIKEVKRARLTEYKSYRPNTDYHEGRGVWQIKADIALPCATQNELHLDNAKQLVANGCIAVCEGANMPTTEDATKYLQENGVWFIPGKASSAGGVATSALEMSELEL